MLRFLPALAWMLMIFLFSAKPAPESTAESVGVSEILISAVERFVDIDPAWHAELVLKLEPYVRKAAHMTEYAVLFLLLTGPVKALSGNPGRSAAFAAAACIFYAAGDELHQRFVPGRAGKLTDVCIDAAGVLIAAFLYLLLTLPGKRPKKKEAGNPEAVSKDTAS